MKCLLQFVALLVAAVLMTQPALAAYAACGPLGAQHTCCMHSAVRAQDATAGMPQPATVSIQCCPAQAACGMGEALRQQPAAPITKHNDGNSARTVAEPVVRRGAITPAISGADSDRLGRYVLFRVFRI